MPLMTSKQSEELLNDEQYSPQNVTNYERVYGANFISPGGKDRAREFLQLLNLEPGQKVLDVGCGVGGGPFLLAEEFRVFVKGVDRSQSMIALAKERCESMGLSELATFEAIDCLEMSDENTYDAVVSRDVFLHIHDKAALFQRLIEALKPGGKLMFTDYCCGPPPWPPGFAKYVERRNYRLHQIQEYAEVLSSAGFQDVESRNITELFVETLSAEIRNLSKAEIKWTTKAGLTMAWKAKLVAAKLGAHRWGLFQARKSAS